MTNATGSGRDVLVVTGIGGMGQAITRRLGSGMQIVLADFNEESLTNSAAQLTIDGFDVHPLVTDVSSPTSVKDLAEFAAGLGPVRSMVHTAGVSSATSNSAAILAVDLLGVAYILDEFERVIIPGGAGVVIASMGGYMRQPIPADHEALLATTPVDELGHLPFATADQFPHAGQAYSYAKRANQLRVRAASVGWGKRGARINSISPGIISTAQGIEELDSPNGVAMRAMINASASQRLGTGQDIAAAAEFLLGPHASFITGEDLLVDGGVIAALKSGHLDLGLASSGHA